VIKAAGMARILGGELAAGRGPQAATGPPRDRRFGKGGAGLYWRVMDLLELLRSQARRYRCAACGKSMADCDINILAQQGNRALVRVTCTSCNDENLLQIVFQSEGEGDGDGEAVIPAAHSRRRRPSIDEGRPEVFEPISSDELLDLHAFLTEHSGDLRQLVGTAS
jgi:hypothetical protein